MVEKDGMYDVVIIGGGPAGLTAGIYGGRAGLSVLVLEKSAEGGQIIQTAEIENYPGGLEGDSGFALAARMGAQATKFNVERSWDSIVRVRLDGKEKLLMGEKRSYKAKTVIVATGTTPLPIDCQGEQDFLGKGISYCATCDGPFFKELEVYVVGGGNSAVQEALFLTKYTRKVTIIHRRDQLRAAKSLQEKAFANQKIDFLWNTVIREVTGEGLLKGMVIEDVKSGERKEINANEEDGTFGLFVFIGAKPQSQLFEGVLDMNKGYILTDEDMHTNIDGVFAAGDVREKSLRQVVTAVADGAIAAIQAQHYIEDYKE